MVEPYVRHLVDNPKSNRTHRCSNLIKISEFMCKSSDALCNILPFDWRHRRGSKKCPLPRFTRVHDLESSQLTHAFQMATRYVGIRLLTRLGFHSVLQRLPFGAYTSTHPTFRSWCWSQLRYRRHHKLWRKITVNEVDFVCLRSTIGNITFFVTSEKPRAI